MDIPTLVAEIRQQISLAPLHFRGVAEVILMKECFAAGQPPVQVTPDLVFDFHVRRLNLPRLPLRLPLVVPMDQMADFCWSVQTALWHSQRTDPFWIVRSFPVDLKTEGRIVSRTVPTKIAFLVDDIHLESSSRRWTVKRVDFGLVHVAALQRKLMPELLEEWEDRAPRWLTLDP